MPADDGIVFDARSVETEVIKEDAEYEGVRAKLALGELSPVANQASASR